MLRHASFLEPELEYDGGDPDGYRSGVLNFTRALGAKDLAVKLFEVPAGQSLCPYHYEYEEEWLIVLDGSAAVRTPAGEHTLERGAVAAFPPGPAGAHKVSNAGEHTLRAIMFSSAREPAVAVYPDSNKIGVWPGNPDDTVMLRRRDGAVDYYDGERA
ncbi:MAG TPA: cupin domain-containing protein [Solirubrobacteraceae bacterium]|nr:cupin domain-containing protein [Solirubrobacteraceae bacterium]